MNELGPSDADYERLATFRSALRRFFRFSAEAAGRAGLTPHQHQALLAIKGRGPEPVTVGDLSEALMIAPHSAAELVGRLRRAGLVDKVEDAADRRRVVLRLTRRAEEALETLSVAHLREVRLLAPRLAAILDDLGAGCEEARGDAAQRGVKSVSGFTCRQ